MSDSSVLIDNIKPCDKKRSKYQLTSVASISLLLSIIAIILGIVGFFKKPTVSDSIVYSVLRESLIDSVSSGNVVSINAEGKIQLGAGTTIKRDVKIWNGEQMTHLHSTNVGKNIIVSAFDGNIKVVYVSDKGVVSSETEVAMPLVGDKMRIVDDLITQMGNVVVVLGSNELLPVIVDWVDNKIAITFGVAVRFTEPASYQPQLDSIGNECVALSYYYSSSSNMNIKIATRTCCLIGKGSEMTFHLNAENLYSENYMFHGIAGLSATKFILAKAVTQDNKKKNLIFQLATVTNGNVTVGKELVLENFANFGFFDIDNLNDHQAVVTFIDGNMANGLESILLVYNQKRDCLIIGPFLDNQDGGASGMADSGSYNFIRIRVMSESRFGVFYSNVMNQGATALSLGEVTPANDLIAVGPEYVISKPMENSGQQYYWLGECMLDVNRLALVESLTAKDITQAHAELHILYVMPLPLGVVVDVGKKAVVAVSGQVTLHGVSFVPGKNYYSDNKGNLVMGEYVGSMNAETYYIYVEDADNNLILSDDNRVGFAINEKTLFLTVHH